MECRHTASNTHKISLGNPKRVTDKVTSLKDSLDAQYKADERGRVFDRPCQVLDDGDLDEH